MRVLVTGSSGFLGWHLVRHLERMGAEVHGTYVLNRPAFERAEVHRLDIREAGECEALLARLSPSHLVHTAAMSQTADCERDPAMARAINVQGTANLLAAASRVGDAPPHFVHVSTDLVFDGKWSDYDETAAPNPIQVYGDTKLQAEELVIESKLTWAILRSALIFGAESPFHSSFLQWMLKLLRRESSGKLFVDEYRSPVWVEDLCHAIHLVGSQMVSGLYHCSGTQRLSRWEFGRLVGQVYGLGVDESLKGTRAQSGLESTRPADVSLNSSNLANAVGWRATDCESALRQIASGKSEAGY
ncbi:MAG: SDR family oxidoreductase [Candidatus Sumerlaeaceae bacterium]